MWIKHPRTGEKDTMLTLAAAGFLFTILFTTASLVAAWILNDSKFLSSVALIDAAILTPSLAAYTARKYTDAKVANGKTEPQGE